MKHFLVIADRPSGDQRIIGRAVEWALRVGAKLTVVGFVYEHIGSLPVALSPGDRAKLQKKLIERHVAEIRQALAGVTARRTVKAAVEVFWEKRVADRVNRIAAERWSKSTHVLAAVDLGTRVRSKQTLNDEIVEQAAAMASLRRERERRAEEYRRSLSQRGITIDGLHVVTGRPAKALGSLAAQERIRLVVLGCVGRRKLAGRVIGNTAEQILRLLKADVLAVKPGSRASVAS